MAREGKQVRKHVLGNVLKLSKWCVMYQKLAVCGRRGGNMHYVISLAGKPASAHLLLCR